MKWLNRLAPLSLLLTLTPGVHADGFDVVTVEPKATEAALRNPLMGLTGRERRTFEWSTLTHHYLGWNELEAKEGDGVEKIVALCDEAWAAYPRKGVKVIPRVYLEYPDKPDAWPGDMKAGDYTSDHFKKRLAGLVAKLAQAWDSDPRVAFIEMGIFGKWGEHHSPGPTAEMQEFAGKLFKEAFKKKRVSVRRAWTDFPGFGFGEYWDSFAHWDEMGETLKGFESDSPVKDLYLSNYFGGEVAYDWGNWRLQPGESPDVTLSEREHLVYMENTVRFTHCTQLRWIGDYSRDNASAVKGAAELQKTLGYRFRITRADFPATIDSQHPLKVSAEIVNDGVAPFYYRWPLQLALLDATSHRVVWSQDFETVDIRTWRPGAGWTAPVYTTDQEMMRVSWPSKESGGWAIPAKLNRVVETFLPVIPAGRYLLALAILDPAGRTPSVRFAIENYMEGGYHPLGYVGVGGVRGGPLETDFPFFKGGIDTTVHYVGNSSEARP